MIKTTYAPERAVYTLEDGMESAGPLTLIVGPAEYIRLDLHEAAVAAARAEGMRAAADEDLILEALIEANDLDVSFVDFAKAVAATIRTAAESRQ